MSEGALDVRQSVTRRGEDEQDKGLVAVIHTEAAS